MLEFKQVNNIPVVATQRVEKVVGRTTLIYATFVEE